MRFSHGVGLVISLCLGVSAVAQCPDQEFVDPLGNFDYGVPAIDEDVLAIPYSDGGVVEMYRKSDCGAWVLEDTVFETAPLTAVAVSGDVLVASEFSVNTVHFYRYDPGSNEWVSEASISHDGNPDVNSFGRDVRVSGDVAIATGRNSSGDVAADEQVWVFRYNTSTNEWSEEQILVETVDGDFGGWEGRVDVTGDRIAIGAPGETGRCGVIPDCTNEGAVYVYRFESTVGLWILDQKIRSPIDGRHLWFGTSVAVDEERIVVYSGLTEVCDPPGFCQAGAYVYASQGGTLFIEDLLKPRDSFGSCIWSARNVDISSNRIVVSSKTTPPGCLVTSTALFEFDGHKWLESQRFIAPDQAISNSVFPYGLSGSDLILHEGKYTSAGVPDRVLAYCIEPLVVDCNNLLEDDCEPDQNTNGISDWCEAEQGDVNLDGVVNVEDLLLVLANWGPCWPPCVGDTNGDFVINVVDLLTLLANWG